MLLEARRLLLNSRPIVSNALHSMSFLRFSKKKTEKLQEWENIPNFAPHQPEL